MAKRHISRSELHRRLAQQRRDLAAMQPLLDEFSTGYLSEQSPALVVSNWKNGWKWFSSWAFLAITFAATLPIPDEVMASLPENIRLAVIAAVAVSGGVLRFVNQSKPPVIEGDT